MKVIAIAALDEARVIGCAGELPWKISEDFRHFANLTRGNTVLMGRKTYDSLPAAYKPLPKRRNVVVTRDPKSLAGEKGIWVRSCPRKFIEDCRSGKEELCSDLLFVIGGEEIYRITMDLWDMAEITRVTGVHEGDAFFPEFEDDFVLENKEEHVGYSFETFVRNA
jgi:dihydrofolate reductase